MFNSGHPLSQAPSVADDDSDVQKARILVVDDEQDIREFLQIALAASGYCDIEVASNASEALLAIDSLSGTFAGTFDCLLIDIQMPMISGIDLCETIRQNPEYSNVPILMITAMSERKYLDSAFAKGATDYICKPFDVMDLRMRIGRARQKIGLHPYGTEQTSALPTRNLDTQSESLLKLDQPVNLAGIDRFVSLNSFENYVLQSSSQGLQNAFVKAVKIANIQMFHRSMSEKNFRAVLRCVAELLSDESMLCGGVLSYRGNGVFLHTGQSKAPLAKVSSNRTKSRNSYLDNIKMVSGHQIELVFGNEVPVSGLSKSCVLFEMNKAILDAEEKDTRSRKWATYSEWRIEQASRGNERDHIELSAYKNLLQNMLLDKNCRLQ